MSERKRKKVRYKYGREAARAIGIANIVGMSVLDDSVLSVHKRGDGAVAALAGTASACGIDVVVAAAAAAAAAADAAAAAVAGAVVDGACEVAMSAPVSDVDPYHMAKVDLLARSSTAWLLH
jgi:hypothetical protein